MLSIRTAGATDAARLAPRLRTADLREIEANLGEEPLAVLERGVALSVPCYAVADPTDEPVALFGVVPDSASADTGLVWLLASDNLSAHPYFVLRNSRACLEELHGRYRMLWNYIDARNELHLRWLRWCGFTLLRRVEDYGVGRLPFYEFARWRDGGA